MNTKGIKVRSAVWTILLLVSAVGAAEYANFRSALNAGNSKLSTRDYAGAHADADGALALAQDAAQRIDVRLLQGRIAAGEGETDRAVEGYSGVLSDEDAGPAQKLSARVGLADLWTGSKDHARAREELAKALAIPGLTPAQRFDTMSRRAQTFDREGNREAARQEYTRIRADEDVDKGWNLRAGIAAARTFLYEGKFEASREWYRKLFDVPEIDSRDRKNIHMGIAYAYEREQLWADARKEYDRALALPGLGESDMLNIYCGIAGSHGGEGNAEAMKGAIELLLPITQGPVVWKIGQLQTLGRVALKQDLPEIAIFACENVLALPGVDVKYRADSYTKLFDAYVLKGDMDGLKNVMTSVIADPELGVKQRFRAQAIVAGVVAIQAGTSVPGKELEAVAEALAGEGLTAADRLDALNAAAGCFNRLHHYDTSREFLALGDALLAPLPGKTYRCRYMDSAPLGAAGWVLSGRLKDETYRESRFDDYDQKAAAMLITDVAADRAVAKGSKKAPYFENTGFAMGYDRAGWHMFVLCGEPDAESILADGKGAGALEMYFSPGDGGETYYQWIINLPKGDVEVYDWNSPHRHYRYLRPHLRTETIAFDGHWGTYIFIPWEAVYDKLPLDGAGWRFGVIRWTPAGGITWGGKVHETGKWGLVDWEKPSAEQAFLIRKNIVRKAWAKYQKTKAAQETYWKDEERGDPVFHETVLGPAIAALDEPGKKLKKPDSLSAADVDSLFAEAVPEWMEFDYGVSELRRRYLREKLVPLAE